jgi:hypothetical protein
MNRDEAPNIKKDDDIVLAGQGYYTPQGAVIDE